MLSSNGSLTLHRDGRTKASLPADHLIGSKVYSENGDIGTIVSVDDNGLYTRLDRLLRYVRLIPKIEIVTFHCEPVHVALNLLEFKTYLGNDVTPLRERIGPRYFARTRKALKESQTLEELFDNFEKFMVYW